MRHLRHLATAMALCALFSSPAWAQTQGNQSTQQPSTPQPPTEDAELRPATTTDMGDTGLWFVPTGEVLPAGRWSASAYRVNWDRTEAFSDVSNFRGTFAFGVADRVEIFGNLDFQRRIDADRRPVRAGGTPMDDPHIFQGWSTGFGDIRIGAKFNITAPWRQQPAAFAIRALAKLPTADDDEGLGTGKVDFLIDAIVSGEAARSVEVGAFGGFIKRGDPDEYDLSDGFRWGFGLGFPSRSRLRLTTEVHGEMYFDDEIVATGSIGGAPASWAVDSPAEFVIGLTYQHPNGFFVGYGASIGLNTTNRNNLSGAAFTTEKTFDRWGNQVRLGWHPGVRVYVAPAPPPPPPPPPAAVQNRPPTVKARCEPCVVEVGRTSTVTADASDPDGDVLAYKWSAPTGTFANPSERQTVFTCPTTPGSVPVTVTVTDGKGGTASDTITIQCVAPAKKEYTFEDVHFDFDRYTLRPEATRILDEAVKAMQADTTLRLTLEGHTCNIGTTEYNLALGERRSNAVRDYLVSRGIGADRLNTVSYGEERPKHDNSREETRRLNRRAALTVRLQ
jgi:outer membrane protein OmpA-like peptidoglycan-associated protein